MHGFDQALWDRLAAMRIEPEGAALSFEARLAREEGWTPAFADRVMREYRRFLYLAATGRDAVSPSRAVDAAWHLHLTYTLHYWEALCPNILGRPLHHLPTEGGPAEDARHDRQYHATLATYEQVFGEAAPADVWPVPVIALPARRALPRGVGIALGVGAATMLLAACAAAPGGGNATLYIPAVIIAVIGVLAVGGFIIVLIRAVQSDRQGRCGSGGSSCGGGSGCGSSDNNSDSSGSSCGSSCGGGCGGGGGGD